MNIIDADFFKELLGMFKMEAAEHVQTILANMNILENEVNVDKKFEALEVIHRSAHSLKGAARTIGLIDMEPICQSLEASFSILKREKVKVPIELNKLIKEAAVELGSVLDSVNESAAVEKDRTKANQLMDDISSQVSALSKS